MYCLVAFTGTERVNLVSHSIASPEIPSWKSIFAPSKPQSSRKATSLLAQSAASSLASTGLSLDPKAFTNNFTPAAWQNCFMILRVSPSLTPSVVFKQALGFFQNQIVGLNEPLQVQPSSATQLKPCLREKPGTASWERIAEDVERSVSVVTVVKKIAVWAGTVCCVGVDSAMSAPCTRTMRSNARRRGLGRLLFDIYFQAEKNK